MLQREFGVDVVVVVVVVVAAAAAAVICQLGGQGQVRPPIAIRLEC